MSDDNSDEIMIGPMPAVEDYSTFTLTTTEPEDNTEGTTLINTSIDQQNHNSANGFDNNNSADYEYQDNTTLANPPSPQALFFLSEMRTSLDDLTYDPQILQLAETNQVNIPWTDLKPIIRSTILKQCDAMESVVGDTEVQSTITSIKTNILHCIDHHSGTPFTIQRICELISAPTRHYTLFIKYLHAIEKVLSVASTWDSFCEDSSAQSTSLPSQQRLENDVYTGYEMPDVVLTPIVDGDIDLDDDDEDDETDDEGDDDDDDDVNDDDDIDETAAKDIDSMEIDNTPAGHQTTIINGIMTADDDKNDAMVDGDDDKPMDQNLEQDPPSS